MPKSVYEFVATGQGDVINAYESISSAAERNKKAVQGAAKATERTARGGGRAARLDSELSGEVAAVRRAEANKLRARERAERHVAGIRDRYFREQQSAEEKADRDKARRASRIASAEAAERKRSRQQSIETLKDIGGGAVLGATAAIAGTIAQATRESMALQESANRISINARKHGEQFGDATALRRSFERTAIETPGIKSQDVADAVQRFISLTGDMDTAMKGQGVFAKVASATGGNIGDVAEAAASLSQQFDIKGLEDMKDALAALTFQGKEGAFELKDAAAQFQALAAAGAAFGIPKGVAGVKTLGGLTQIARTGTKGAAQAATSVQDLLSAFKAKGKDLRAAGVEVYDKEGKARDIRELITESIAKVGGTNVAKKQEGLTKIFGEQGIRAINPLIAKYNETFRGTQGSEAEKTAAAMAMLREEFRKSIDAAGDWDDVLDDSAQAQKNASAQLDSAWERIKASVGDKVVPAMADLVEKLAGQDGADGALEPFIEAAGLATEALGGLADVIRSLPGFKAKDKTHAELAQQAEKELRRFDKSHNTISYTKDELAKRKALVDRIAAEKDQVFTKPGEGGPMSPEEFAKKYVSLNPEFAGGEDAALGLAKRLASGQNTGFVNNDLFQQTIGGENQAQTDLRRQFAGQALSDRMAAEQPKVKTEDLQASLDALAKGVAAANAAMAAQGTIFAQQ